MRIKSKNIVQAIIQAISILILFLPFVYTEEIWVDVSGHGGAYECKNDYLISFFDKMNYLESGAILGGLAVAAMVITLLLLIVQLAKRSHIQVIPVIGIVATALFFFYSVSFAEEPWEGSWGPEWYCKYPTAFGFVLVLALQIALVIIGFISNARIKQSGIIEEEKKQYVPNNVSNAEELGKYKDLLDKGVITQEEFEAKKKQLLEL